MRISFCLISLLTTSVFAFAAPEIDPVIKTAAERAAQTCLACHDQEFSPNPLWPKLAGQKKEYIKKALNDFKSEARKNEIMSPMAMTLNDEQIELVSTFFSTQDPCEKK